MALLQHLYCHSYRLSGGFEKSHKLKGGDINDHRDNCGGHGDDHADDYGDDYCDDLRHDHGDDCGDFHVGDCGDDYGEEITWQKN